MIELFGSVYQITALEVVTRLRDELHANGSHLLRDLKIVGNNAMVTCPAHAAGVERRPSCGISLSDTASSERITKAGTVHCFACGYIANLPEFVSRCHGLEDKGIFGYQWLMRHFYIDEQHSRELAVDMSRSAAAIQIDEVSEDELQSYRYIHPYMAQRKLTEQVIELFDIGYDKLTDCITFPLYNEHGRVLAIQRRAVKQKLFHNKTGFKKSDILYGYYQLMRLQNKPSTVIVCESILDALFCWSCKIPAVALLGSKASDKQLALLRGLHQREIILALDNDEAGQAGQAYLKKHLQQDKLIQELRLPAEYKDIGELDAANLSNLVRNSSRFN